MDFYRHVNSVTRDFLVGKDNENSYPESMGPLVSG